MLISTFTPLVVDNRERVTPFQGTLEHCEVEHVADVATMLTERARRHTFFYVFTFLSISTKKKDGCADPIPCGSAEPADVIDAMLASRQPVSRIFSIPVIGLVASSSCRSARMCSHFVVAANPFAEQPSEVMAVANGRRLQ